MSALAELLGVIAVVIAFSFDTAPSGTHNLGLLQQQMMILQCGIGLIIVSAVLSLKGGVGSSVSRSSVSSTLVEDDERVIELRTAHSQFDRNVLIAMGVLVALIFAYLALR